MKKNYAQLLRDPRWQKKRLEIMQRDDFTCMRCYTSKETLNVHHCYYVFGRNPWEYENESLLTLCEHCHEGETNHGKQAKDSLVRALARKGFTGIEFEDLASSIEETDFSLFGYPPEVVASIIAFAIRSEDFRAILIEEFWKDTKERARRIERINGGWL